MKILFINTVYKNGGSTGRIVYDLRNLLLSSEENDAYVAYGYEFKVLSDEDYVNTYKRKVHVVQKFPLYQLYVLKLSD